MGNKRGLKRNKGRQRMRWADDIRKTAGLLWRKVANYGRTWMKSMRSKTQRHPKYKSLVQVSRMCQ